MTKRRARVVRNRDNRFSAMNPVALLHLRDDLRIGQLVRGLDSHNTLRQRSGRVGRVLASPSAQASLDALLAHLFASRFAQSFVYRLLRQRLPMSLPWGVDWSPAEARRRRCCLFRRCLRWVFLRGLATCHSFPSRGISIAYVTVASPAADPDLFRGASEEPGSVALAPARHKSRSSTAGTRNDVHNRTDLHRSVR